MFTTNTLLLLIHCYYIYIVTTLLLLVASLCLTAFNCLGLALLVLYIIWPKARRQGWTHPSVNKEVWLKAMSVKHNKEMADPLRHVIVKLGYAGTSTAGSKFCPVIFQSYWAKLK